MTFALVNGAQVREEDATVSINDRGFRYGDGAFETIPLHDGLPYLWEYHRERLSGTLEALGIPYDTSGLLPQALALIEANGRTGGLLRIQVSRGAGSRGYLPAGVPQPTVVVQVLDHPAPPSRPVTLWLSSYEKISPRALPTGCKLAHALGSTLARMEAERHGCSEALQLAEGQWVSEASSANIFWRKNGRLHTPSLDCGTLAGVTRRRVMELSPAQVSEGRYALDDLLAAEAVILTNASFGAAAVAGLEPKGKTWDSGALAHEINAMIYQDIKRHIVRLRESLART